MDDYKNIIVEYKCLQNMLENEINDLNLIYSKIKSFIDSISSLQNNISDIPDIPNGSFGFLNPILKNFAGNIQKDISKFNDIVLNQLDTFIYSFKFATTKNLTLFNEIKCDLFEEKKLLENKRDAYFNYINESEKSQSQNTKNNFFRKEKPNKINNINNNNDMLSKTDENIFNNALKENYYQLYQYELNKMNDLISECNTRYSNIYHEISAINASLKITVRDCLIKFAKNLNNFANTFNMLSEDIINKINSLKILNNEEISQSVDKVTSSTNEIRFTKEKLEKSKKIEAKDKNVEKNIEKKKLFPFFSKKKSHNSSKNLNNNDNNKIRMEEDDTFELVSQQRIKDEQLIKDNKELMDDIIKKIVDEEELKSKEITNLLNILANDKEGVLYSTEFLKKIKKYYNHRVITFKNKNNFTHLSNIMNDLCLKHKKNYNIFKLIIEVSQMIKYKNIYIYKIVQKKNEFFSTKSLWLQIIDNDLILELNNYIEMILSKKIDDKNKTKENGEKDEKSNNNVLERLCYNRKLLNYKKLNKIQKKELVQFSKEKICIILSESISGMCCFLVPQKTIEEIILYYGAQFKFENDIKCYLKNKMIVKNMKIKHTKKFCDDKNEKINNKIIVISSLSNFYPIKKYSSLFLINKDIYPKLRKNIFLNLLSDNNLKIESHLKLWKEYLQIEKLKKELNYQNIKEKLKIINDDKIEFVIEKDVLRTVFIQKNKDNQEHINNLKSILVSFEKTFPNIGYCQGMNCVVGFLYQLLDYNEEETFYLFCSFLKNSKYHEIFQDDFMTLKKFFIIFEKILNINRPEIYYKFLDNNLVTNSYSSSWFITLFTEYVFIFDKNNPPKFVFYVIERFILEGWSAIFNCGLTLLEYCYEKIMALEKDKLLTYLMNILDNEKILENDNYDLVKELYLKNSILINEYFFGKLLEITTFEENNKYLIEA